MTIPFLLCYKLNKKLCRCHLQHASSWLMDVPPTYVSLQVIHTQSVVMAALTFASHLKRHKAVPLQRAAGQEAGGMQQQLPSAPQTLAEQVLQSFALNNIPIHQPLILPMLIPSLECPGERHHSPLQQQLAKAELHSVVLLRACLGIALLQSRSWAPHVLPVPIVRCGWKHISPGLHHLHRRFRVWPSHKHLHLQRLSAGRHAFTACQVGRLRSAACSDCHLSLSNSACRHRGAHSLPTC